MSETSDTASNPATAQELAEIIVEFEQYRERLIKETTTVAQKAKLSKKTVMAKLEPKLAEIDATLERLRQQAAQTEN